MKKLALTLLLAAVSSVAQNVTGSVNFTGFTASVKFPDTTFALLPAPSSGNSGDVYRVTDASSSACTAGGGTVKCHVVSTGADWVLFGGAVSGTTDFSELTGSATDAQIPNNITINLAAAATALAANGTNCAPGSYPLGVDASGNAEGCTAASGSGTVTVVSSGSLTSTALVTGGSGTALQTPSATATLSAAGNLSLPGSVSTGVGGSAAGYLELSQGTATTAGTTSVKLQAPTSVTSYIWTLPSTAGSGFLYGTNSSGNVTLSQVTNVTQTIASGTAAMTTAAIAAGACGSTVTVAASGVASTDVITFNPNASIKAVTGYTAAGGISIRQWPTTNSVNFELCNGSTASITPGAVTVNWRVQR